MVHASVDGNVITQTRYTFAEPVSDDAFAAFCAQFPDMQAERDGRNMIVFMTPAGNRTSKLNAELIRLVGNWNAELPEPGGVYDSDTAFAWPEGSLKGPDCAWFAPERDRELEAAGKTFGVLVPDVVFELRSPSDTWIATTDKCRRWSEMGSSSAVAIDPQGQRVDVNGAQPPESLLAIARTIASMGLTRE